MTKFFPKSMMAQLVVLLVCVVLVGQIINFFLIIGGRNLQVRAQMFAKVLDVSVRYAQTLPQYSEDQFPIGLRPARELPGAYSLSAHSRAALIKNAKPLPKYQRQYGDMLRASGIDPLAVQVVLQTKRPMGFKGRDRREVKPNEYGRPPPPRRSRSGERRPEVFRPPKRPKANRDTALGLQTIVLSAEIAPGVWYNVMVPHYSMEGISPRLFLATGIVIVLMVLAIWFFTRRITRPLKELTIAADRFGRDETLQALEESGPSDIRTAAAAFNVMQHRLARVLKTQRFMLRAVSHDLMSPLTALRIRAESIPDEVQRGKFIATINDMVVMTEEILNWAKDTASTEESARVDLDAFLASLVDDYQDQGKDVCYEDCGSFVFDFKRVALKRALVNLIDNALKYGKSARISVQQSPEHIRIRVEDDGDGIPKHKLKDVLKPFVRLETSRNKETGGIGLGLSIADTIAQTAGGRLELVNVPGGGLRACIHLPIYKPQKQ